MLHRVLAALSFTFAGILLLSTPANAATINLAYSCEDNGDVTFYAAINQNPQVALLQGGIILDGGTPDQQIVDFTDVIHPDDFALLDIEEIYVSGSQTIFRWLAVTVSGLENGEHTVRTTATPAHVNQSPLFTWEIELDCGTIDDTPPIVVADVSESVLWYFLYQMQDIGLDFLVEDDQDPEPQVDILVYSDEPEDEFGNGWFTPDVQLTPSGELELRAERSWWEDGRVYLIVVVATDASGNQGFDCVSVGVPRSWWPGDVCDLFDQMLDAEDVCLETLNPPENFELLFSTMPE